MSVDRKIACFSFINPAKITLLNSGKISMVSNMANALARQSCCCYYCYDEFHDIFPNR